MLDDACGVPGGVFQIGIVARPETEIGRMGYEVAPSEKAVACQLPISAASTIGLRPRGWSYLAADGDAVAQGDQHGIEIL